MATYELEMRCEDGGSETIEIEADDIAEARETAEEETKDWIKDGEWGQAGAVVSGWWTLADEDGDEIDEGSVTIEIEPDHDALIRAAGGDTDCDHDWTSEGEGGLRENPGVWSKGGTTLVFASHCRTCGLHKTEVNHGSQRNHGQADTVEYRQPKTWCAECEAEECRGDHGEDEDDTTVYVIRNGIGEYLTTDGTWTADPAEAAEYLTLTDASLVCQETPLDSATVETR